MQYYPPYPWRCRRHTLGSPRQPITVTAADIQISQKIIEYTNVCLKLRGVGGFNKKPLVQYYPPYPWRSSRHTLGFPRQTDNRHSSRHSNFSKNYRGYQRMT